MIFILLLRKETNILRANYIFLLFLLLILFILYIVISNSITVLKTNIQAVFIFISSIPEFTAL